MSNNERVGRRPRPFRFSHSSSVLSRSGNFHDEHIVRLTQDSIDRIVGALIVLPEVQMVGQVQPHSPKYRSGVNLEVLMDERHPAAIISTVDIRVTNSEAAIENLTMEYAKKEGLSFSEAERRLARQRLVFISGQRGEQSIQECFRAQVQFLGAVAKETD